MTRVVQRRQRAVERTREDILEAAARAFATSGYQSATMRDIAKEAGYTAAALYTYFENKQEILGALVKQVIDDFLGVIEEPVPAGLGFPRRLELLVRRLLEQAERRRAFFLVLFALAQANQHPRPGKQHPDPVRTMKKVQARLARWFSETASKAELGGHRAEDAARFLIGVTHGFMGDWVMRGSPPGQFIGEAPLIVDLLLHGVSGPSSARGKEV